MWCSNKVSTMVHVRGSQLSLTVYKNHRVQHLKTGQNDKIINFSFKCLQIRKYKRYLPKRYQRAE